MATKWFKTKYPGVRYRKHSSRRIGNGVDFDRYYTIRYKLDGRDREESIGWASEGIDQEKAYEKLAELRQNSRAGIGPKTLAAKRLVESEKRDAECKAKTMREKAETTFGQFWENEYLPKASALKKPNTAYTEIGIYKNWLTEPIGHTPLKDITPSMLDAIVMAALKAGKAPRTTRYILAVVSQVWNMAHDYNVVTGENPVKRVKKPKSDNRRTRFLTQAEANALLNELSKRSTDTHDAAVLSLFCGLRAGEINALTWADIDFKNETIAIRDPKNKHGRHAFMPAEVRMLLEKRRQGQAKNEFVIPDANGKRRVSVSNIFEKVVAELGFNKEITDSRQKVVFHTCRHSFASWLVQRGIPLYTVGELLGHNTLEMTKRYSHLAPDDMRRAAMRLQGVLEEKHGFRSGGESGT